MQRVNHLPRRVISIVLTIVMVASVFSGILPGLGVTAKAAANEIANDSLKISVGDLGQISTLNIVNNPRNRSNREINFVLPNDTRPQNGVQHQWMGEMIFSVRSSADGSFPADNTGFVEVDTNRPSQPAARPPHPTSLPITPISRRPLSATRRSRSTSSART